MKPLKDEQRKVYKDEIAAIRKELDKRYERMGDRVLGRQEKDSTSVKASSGGRPESNRRKF
jgi:hypothetical protein